jgi:hypothetical protein
MGRVHPAETVASVEMGGIDRLRGEQRFVLTECHRERSSSQQTVFASGIHGGVEIAEALSQGDVSKGQGHQKDVDVFGQRQRIEERDGIIDSGIYRCSWCQYLVQPHESLMNGFRLTGIDDDVLHRQATLSCFGGNHFNRIDGRIPRLCYFNVHHPPSILIKIGDD